MTGEYAIESAVFALAKAALKGDANEPAIVPFVAFTNDVQPIRYPCIAIACDPFKPIAPGAPMGTVNLRVGIRTHADNDKDRQVLERLFETTTGLITAPQIGPLVLSPWLVCGVDNTPDGAISIDPETKVQEKVRAYKVALFNQPTTPE